METVDLTCYHGTCVNLCIICQSSSKQLGTKSQMFHFPTKLLKSKYQKVTEKVLASYSILFEYVAGSNHQGCLQTMWMKTIIIISKQDELLTPYWANGPSYNDIWVTLHRSLHFVSSAVLWPPCIPAPSAIINSSSGVEPPVTKVLISVNAFSLK